MRKLYTHYIPVLLTMLMSVPQLYAQTEKAHIRTGNKQYEDGKYEEAEQSYRAAIDENTNSLEGAFNLGDAAYKQENYDDAINQFKLLSKKVGTPEEAAKFYHNLGNSYFGKKEYQKSVDAYKQALRNNPKDMDTRYNLAYAQQKLKQQQQQQKEKKDKNENDEKKDEEKKEEEKKKDEEKKEDEKKENQKKDEKKSEEDKEQKQQPKPDQLSKEEAQKILEALKNREMDVQDKLQKKKHKATKVKVDKDW